jgi:hypothetical protein
MQALNVIENPRFECDKSTKIQVIKSNQIGVDALYLKPGQAHGPHRLPDRDRVRERSRLLRGEPGMRSSARLPTTLSLPSRPSSQPAWKSAVRAFCISGCPAPLRELHRRSPSRGRG